MSFSESKKFCRAPKHGEVVFVLDNKGIEAKLLQHILDHVEQGILIKLLMKLINFVRKIGWWISDQRKDPLLINIWRENKLIRFWRSEGIVDTRLWGLLEPSQRPISTLSKFHKNFRTLLDKFKNMQESLKGLQSIHRSSKLLKNQ